jgi:arylsulfatase
MKTFQLFSIVFLGTGLLSLAGEKPNIIVILADDMGYADTQPYGSEIKTPNLMRLAESGLRFTEFHNCVKCSPSRACIMTGLYPQQAGMATLPKAGMNPKAEEDGAGELSKQSVTIAQVLKSAGYATYMSGKWHLTAEVNAKTEAAKFGWPRQRGFDRFFGFLGGVSSYFNPKELVSDNTPVPAPPESYSTDLFTEHACDFITTHARTQPNTPFFLYLAYNAPHWGLQAPTADIERYKGVYDIGWDKMREQRLAREKQLGVIPPSCNLSLRNEEVPAWATLESAKKTNYAEAMAIYAGAITAMDRGVGQLLTTLDKTKLRDNTLVIFLSDNGACAEGQTGVKSFPHASHPSARIGPGWANVGNTPFRYWKNTTWEGGSATELIMNWPAGIGAAQRGAITDQVGHIIDLMPTCVELAGASYPKTFKGNPILPMEGRSLVPTLEGKVIGPRELFWKYLSYDSDLIGFWKLTRKEAGKDKDWMLFNLSQDRSEMHDISQSHPEVVNDLAAKWQAWADRVQVKGPKKTKNEKQNQSSTND